MILSELLENTALRVAIVIVAAFVVQLIAHKLIAGIVHSLTHYDRYAEQVDHKKRIDTFISIFRASIGIAVWLATIVIVLKLLDVNLASVATGAGLMGIVIGFGAQTTIRDYLSGIFILFENQYRVGDVINLSGGSLGAPIIGTVEDISLRITKLRSLDGSLYVVSNGEPATVTNLTFGYASVVVEIPIVYSSDMDAVESAMNEAGLAMLEDDSISENINQPIQFSRINEFVESGMIVRAMGNVIPGTQWATAGRYRRLVLKAFDKSGIEIALPHRVIMKEKSFQEKHPKTKGSK